MLPGLLSSIKHTHSQNQTIWRLMIYQHMLKLQLILNIGCVNLNFLSFFRISITISFVAFWMHSWTVKLPRNCLVICSFPSLNHRWHRPSYMAKCSIKWLQSAATQPAPPSHHIRKVNVEFWLCYLTLIYIEHNLRNVSHMLRSL